MGFGSYDESEQRDPDVDGEDEETGVTVHHDDHDGEVTFETDESPADLVDRLHDMEDDEDDE